MAQASFEVLTDNRHKTTVAVHMSLARELFRCRNSRCSDSSPDRAAEVLDIGWEQVSVRFGEART